MGNSDRDGKLKNSPAGPASAVIAVFILCEVLLIFQIFSFFQSQSSYGVSIEKWAYLGDFNHYYATGIGVLKGMSPYCRPLTEFQPDPRVRWHILVAEATNPPFFALLTSPLAMLPLESSWAAWQVFLVFCLFGSIAVLGRNLSWNFKEYFIAFVLCAQSGPTILNFRYAQIQPLLLLLTILGWSAFRRGQQIRCGLFWGLGVAIKFYLWPLLLLLLIKRAWRGFIAGCGLAGFCLALPVFVIGSRVYNEFAECGKPLIEKSALFIAMNFSVGGILQHSLFAFRIPILKNTEPPFSMMFYWGPLTFAGISLILAMYYLRRCSSEAERNLSVALATLLGFMTSPVAWPHYFIFALFVSALLYERGASFRLCVILCAIAFLPFESLEPYPGMPEYHRYLLAWRPLPSIFLLLFVGWNVATANQRERTNGETPLKPIPDPSST